MRKTFYLAGLAAFALAMGACGNCDKSGKCAASPNGSDDDKAYTGVLPSADTEGIRYTLKLDYDDDHNYTDGDYDLVESYLKADSTLKVGVRDSISYASEGDFKVEENAGKKYIRLTPEKKYTKAEPLTFLVESDSTLLLVGNDFTAPVQTEGLNYTLKLVK